MKIEEMILEHCIDNNPDTSWLGRYTDDRQPNIIVRQHNDWIGNCVLFMGSDAEREVQEIPQCGREFRFFKPYAGGEKPGTKRFRKYGMKDYERMEGLQRGDWYFIGVVAKATVSYPVGNNRDKRLEQLSSGGLWGVESDGGEYLDEVNKEQLEELREHLTQFGITVSDEDWEALIGDLEPQHK